MAQYSDILVLGGGIAGMTAAIYARRANLSCTLLEPHICGGLVNSTDMVENFPSRIAIHGMELMELVTEQVKHLGAQVEEACEIEKLDIAGPVKKVFTDLGEFEAKAIFLATGRKPLPLEAENAEDCEQVHYCAICDGSPYKDKKVLVVGGGNSGFDEALYLMNLGVKELLLVELMPRFFAAEAAQKALLSRPGTSARHSTKVMSVNMENNRLVSVTLENTNTKQQENVSVDGVFVFMGQSPNTEMFNDVILLDKSGYITTNESMETNVPGVYALGDVRTKMFRQMTTAMSDGTIAALSAERYIRA